MSKAEESTNQGGETPPFKICLRCKKTKLLSEYPPNKQTKDGKQPDCRPCYSARRKAYCQANREKVQARSKQYYQRNAAALKDKRRKYYRANRKRVLEHAREYRQRPEVQERLRLWREDYIKREGREYREKQKLYLQRYYQQNKDRARARNQRWKAGNKERVTAIRLKRRARDKGALGSHTAEDVLAKLEFQGNLCYYCGANLLILGYHVDHKIPLAGGGSNWPANLAPACPSCNLRKGEMNFWQFLETLAND